MSDSFYFISQFIPLDSTQFSNNPESNDHKLYALFCFDPDKYSYSITFDNFDDRKPVMQVLHESFDMFYNIEDIGFLVSYMKNGVFTVQDNFKTMYVIVSRKVC